MYCLGIMIWSLSISGWHISELSRAFEFRIEPVHPDHCGGLKALGNFCFGLASPLFIGLVFYIGVLFVMVMLSDVKDLATFLPIIIGFVVVIVILYVFPAAILAFFLPLWNIHMKMLEVREREEETYAANIAALREQIQALLSDNQLEEAKAVKEKKELEEAIYIPSPTWPFHIRAKFFSVFLAASGSVLLGFLTALQPYILRAIFKY